MFAVRFDVDAEIFVTFRIGEAVMLLQSIDLRFTYCRDLALIRIERRQTLCRRSVAADGAKRIDQPLCLGLCRRFCKVDIIDAVRRGDKVSKKSIGRPKSRESGSRPRTFRTSIQSARTSSSRSPRAQSARKVRASPRI